MKIKFLTISFFALTSLLFWGVLEVSAKACVTSTSPEDVNFFYTTFNDVKGADNYFEIQGKGNILCHQCKFISNKVPMTDCQQIMAKTVSNSGAGRVILYNDDFKVYCSKQANDLGRVAFKLYRSVSKEEKKIINFEINQLSNLDKKLSQRLAGKLLLQTEKGYGDATGLVWYLDQKSGNKIFIKNPEAAYELLRNFGRGISTDDLEKIPVGYDVRLVNGLKDSDSDTLSDSLEAGLGTDPNKGDTNDNGFDDATDIQNGFDPRSTTQGSKLTANEVLIKRLGNGIFLQVAGLNAHGQAWLIKDGLRFYIDPSSAFNAMRYLSTGISNKDLRKIQVAELIDVF